MLTFGSNKHFTFGSFDWHPITQEDKPEISFLEIDDHFFLISNTQEKETVSRPKSISTLFETKIVQQVYNLKTNQCNFVSFPSECCHFTSQDPSQDFHSL